MFDGFFHWLDGDPARFHAAVWITFALAAALALGRWRGARWWNAAPWFALALFLGLFAHRWTVVLDPQRHGNPDETQILADAIAYAHDPVPFRSVDTNTAGPLSSMSVLMFAKLLGRPVDLIAARAYGLFCLFVLLVATWRTLAAVTSETRARLLTLPALPVIGGTYNFDMMQFNNEHPPAAWLALAVWALAPLLDHSRTLPRWRLALGALLIGAAPLAKPQVAPMALWLAAAGLVLLWRHPPSRPGRNGSFALYAVMGVLPAVAIFGTCFAAGAWDDMWATFIGNNLAYVGHRHFQWWESPAAVLGLVRDAQTLMPAFRAELAAGVLVLVAARWMAPALRRLSWVAVGFFVAAMIVVAAPGKVFVHYDVFLLHPGVLLLGVVTAALLEIAERLGTTRKFPGWLAPSVVWAVWFFGVLLPTPRANAERLPLRYGSFGGREAAEPQLVEALRKYTAPGGPLAVWGWSPWIYVWAQQPHAPREANSQRQYEGWGDVGFYRRRLVADLARQKPTVFIDATGPADFALKSRELEGHEKFFAVLRYVGLNYQYMETVADVRLFVRRDRLPRAQWKFDPRARELTQARPAPDFFAGLPPSNMEIGDCGRTVNAHAPCLLVWHPVEEARRARFSFGINSSAYSGGNVTDGVEFRVLAIDADGNETVLFRQLVDPLGRPADRGLHSGEVLVPAYAQLVFETDPGAAQNNNFDWAYWKEIVLEP